MTKRSILLILLMTWLSEAGCGSANSTGPTPTSAGVFTSTDLVVGTGATAVSGNTVTVAYTGWLYDTSKSDGKGSQFDSNTTFSFILGAGRVIAGWDRGVVGMNVGGQRRLIIPPDLAYGGVSPGAGIPANATLLFDITLKSIP